MERMQIEIQLPGMMTTIQDLGRRGHRQSGVPLSGAMDLTAAKISNILVGNAADAAVIEMVYGGCQFYARTDILVCCCGGGAHFFIDDKPAPYWRPLYIKVGSILSFKTSKDMIYSYLSIYGGWDCPLVLNSKSTYIQGGFGGISGRALKKRDILSNSIIDTRYGKNIDPTKKWLSGRWTVNVERFISYKSNKPIRIMKGHEFEWFDKRSQNGLINSTFAVSSKSDRMGYMLEGKKLSRVNNRELLSTAVIPGTIQVTTAGIPIILMSDSQTTGGYPRIGQVAAVDIPRCAQTRPGEQLSFQFIDEDEALQLYLDHQRKLNLLEDILNIIRIY